MAIPATGPVAENVHSVIVERSMKLALNAWSVCYVLGMPLPLVMLSSVEIPRLGIMTLEAHRRPRICEISVRVCLAFDIHGHANC